MISVAIVSRLEYYVGDNTLLVNSFTSTLWNVLLVASTCISGFDTMRVMESGGYAMSLVWMWNGCCSI